MQLDCSKNKAVCQGAQLKRAFEFRLQLVWSGSHDGFKSPAKTTVTEYDVMKETNHGREGHSRRRVFGTTFHFRK